MMNWAKLLTIVVAAGGQCAQHGDHGSPTPAPIASVSHEEHAGPVGYAPVMIDPSRVGPLGLATAKVEHRVFTKKMRTVGIVTLDETRTAHVHTKVKGFVEALPANFVGKSVKRGEVLAGIYSQAVLAAQLEHLSLLKKPEVGLFDPTIAAAEDKSWQKIIEASRRRLMLWDVPRAQIDRLEKTGEVQRTYPIASPRAGTLVAKQAVLGTYVEPGIELFTISDLSNLWVMIDVYESDIPHLAVGQQVKLTIAGTADPITSKVSFVAPTIDESTRTLKARVDLENPKNELRPGAFADVELEAPLGHGLAVPEAAVIRTGTRNIVFIVHTTSDGGAHIVPSEVTLGAAADGFYRVTSGVVAGDAVATSAQFLIDSESRLKATAGTSGGGHSGHH
jgi:membrane fusion protein, copper/silver efflux system